MNVFFVLSSINRYLFLAGIGGVLLGFCSPGRANDVDDQIGRLVAQAQTQAAAHAAGDVAKTIDEVAKLVPRASPEGVAAMTKLMEDLDRMMLDAEREPADAGAAPVAAAPVAAAPVAPASVAPAPSLPVAQARPAPALVETGLLDLLRRRGDAAFQVSDISGARRYYQRGAEAGCAACAEGLARTYDARELRRIGAIGIAPDPALAETWRSRARQLGRNGTPQ